MSDTSVIVVVGPRSSATQLMGKGWVAGHGSRACIAAVACELQPFAVEAFPQAGLLSLDRRPVLVHFARPAAHLWQPASLHLRPKTGMAHLSNPCSRLGLSTGLRSAADTLRTDTFEFVQPTPTAFEGRRSWSALLR